MLYAGSKDKFDAGEESVELPLAAGENVLMLEVKHALPVTRFFFQPDFGAAFEKELYAKLDADFPTPQPLETEFRSAPRLFRRPPKINTIGPSRLIRLPETLSKGPASPRSTTAGSPWPRVAGMCTSSRTRGATIPSKSSSRGLPKACTSRWGWASMRRPCMS
ncbi:MAG: hypothetical protein QM775_00960 [Pirellulales bacterium]